MGKFRLALHQSCKNAHHEGKRDGCRTFTAPFNVKHPYEKNSATPTSGWTFLTHHAHVIILLTGEGDLPLREVASRVGFPERAVQRIVADLEAGLVLSRTRVGRKNNYFVNSRAMLRHPIQAHRCVGDFLKMVYA